LKHIFWPWHVRRPQKVEIGGLYGYWTEQMVELKMVQSVSPDDSM